MAVRSILIEHQGVYAGHALSLGKRFTFHTSMQELADLDEVCFNSIEAIRAAVTTILVTPSHSPLAAA